MKTAAETGRLRRVATARMPTKWGMFHATGFERTVANGISRAECALAIVMGSQMAEAPLLRIHSQCFTGEALGSLRCDCGDQLSMNWQSRRRFQACAPSYPNWTKDSRRKGAS